MQPEFVVVPTVFGAIGFIVWTISTNIRRSKVAHVVADLHGKVLEKCSANQELMAYVQSDAGRRFLESAGESQANPTSRILNAVQAGTILSLLGGASILTSNFHSELDAREFFVTLGYMILAVGLGFLVSAGVSYGLCKTWGLLNRGDVRNLAG
jgi:hypothetical protein